jgi:hypothetical protein
MRTRFFTNRRDNALIDKFADVFANNADIRLVDANRKVNPEIIISESFV